MSSEYKSRREFLKISTKYLFSSAFVSVAGAVFFAPAGQDLYNYLKNKVEELSDAYQNSRDNINKIDTIFGMQNKDIKIYGSLTDKKTQSFTPATKIFFDIIEKIRLEKIHEKTSIKYDMSDELNGNLFFIGGPIRNIMSRIILGLGRTSPIEYFSTKKEKNFPCYFYIPKYKDQYNKIEYVKTLLSGGLMTPNGEIGVSYGENNFITEDYLLITKIPNIFSNKNSGQFQSIFIFSGIRSPATTAFELLIKDNHYTNLIINSVNASNSSCWQALFKIECNKETQIPEKISAFRFFEAEMSFSKTIISENLYRSCALYLKGAKPFSG